MTTCLSCGKNLVGRQKKFCCRNCGKQFRNKFSKTGDIFKCKKKLRVCLSCDKEFLSYGPHNRICGPCKRKRNYEFKNY